MREHLTRTRLERRTRRLEQAASKIRLPRPSAADQYSAAAITAGLRG